jgi:hypothetical protein
VPYPKLSPIQAPDLVCYTCGVEMRRQIFDRKHGGIEKIVYYCDSESCRYGLALSMEHPKTVNDTYVAPPPSLVPGIVTYTGADVTGSATVATVNEESEEI